MDFVRKLSGALDSFYCPKQTGVDTDAVHNIVHIQEKVAKPFCDMIPLLAIRSTDAAEVDENGKIVKELTFDYVAIEEVKELSVSITTDIAEINGIAESQDRKHCHDGVNRRKSPRTKFDCFSKDFGFITTPTPNPIGTKLESRTGLEEIGVDSWIGGQNSKKARKNGSKSSNPKKTNKCKSKSNAKGYEKTLKYLVTPSNDLPVPFKDLDFEISSAFTSDQSQEELDHAKVAVDVASKSLLHSINTQKYTVDKGVLHMNLDLTSSELYDSSTVSSSDSHSHDSSANKTTCNRDDPLSISIEHRSLDADSGYSGDQSMFNLSPEDSSVGTPCVRNSFSSGSSVPKFERELLSKLRNICPESPLGQSIKFSCTANSEDDIETEDEGGEGTKASSSFSSSSSVVSFDETVDSNTPPLLDKSLGYMDSAAAGEYDGDGDGDDVTVSAVTSSESISISDLPNHIERAEHHENIYECVSEEAMFYGEDYTTYEDMSYEEGEDWMCYNQIAPNGYASHGYPCMPMPTQYTPSAAVHPMQYMPKMHHTSYEFVPGPQAENTMEQSQSQSQNHEEYTLHNQFHFGYEQDGVYLTDPCAPGPYGMGGMDRIGPAFGPPLDVPCCYWENLQRVVYNMQAEVNYGMSHECRQIPHVGRADGLHAWNGYGYGYGY